MPLPTDTLLRGLPSPLPTQTTSGLAWLTAMAPIDATGWSSNTGVQVSPPLTDFQTPPAAAPAYITSGLDSTTSMAGTRPLMVAGPIDRAFSPASRSGSTGAAANAPQGTNASAASAEDLKSRCMVFSRRIQGEERYDIRRLT